MRGRNRLLGGTILLTVGAILLANNLGWLSWDVWPVLARFWPALVILAGVELLTKGTPWSWTAPAAVVVLAAALIVYGAVAIRHGAASSLTPWDEGQVPRGGTLSGRTNTTVLEGPSTAGLTAFSLKGSFGAATLDLAAAPGSQRSLYKAVCLSDQPRAPLDRVTIAGGKARVRLWQPLDFIPGQVSSRWNIRLASELPLDVDISTGASDAHLDFGKLRLRSAALSLGAGKVDLWLGAREPRVAVKVSGGAGEIHVRVPRDTGMRLRLHGGFSSHNLSGAGFAQQGEAWENAAYATAPVKVEMDISAVASRLEVGTY